MISIPLSRKSKSEGSGFGKWKRVFRDAYPFYRPEYFLIAGPQGLCFFSVLPGRRVTILAETQKAEIDDRAFGEFLINLSHKGLYFGQEITLLFPEPATYTVLRVQEKTGLDNLRQECKELAKDSVSPQIHSVSLLGGLWYVIEGFDDKYVKKTLDVLQDQGFLVNRILSLSGYVIGNMRNPRVDHLTRSLTVKLGQYTSILNLEEKNQPFYYEVMESGCQSVNRDNLQQIKKLLNAGNPEKQQVVFSVHSDSGSGNKTTRPLKDYFRFSIRRREAAEFSLKDYNVPANRYWFIAANSARLAVFIMLSLLVTASVVAITLSGLRNNSQALYDQYQDKLAQIYSIENELAKVRTKMASLDAGSIKPRGFSNLLSVFCQNIPSDVYLSSLQCQHTPEGSLRATAHGRAGRETSVFRYKEYLSESSQNMKFEIKSISQLAPQAVGPDSLSYQFILGTQ